MEVIIERKILEYLRDIMPFRWCHLHMTAHTAFLWRWGGTLKDGFGGTIFSFLSGWCTPAVFLADF